MRNKRVCDYIAEAIQNEILSGRMSSGVPLRQEELADSLGYSRIPIREALQILESQQRDWQQGMWWWLIFRTR